MLFRSFPLPLCALFEKFEMWGYRSLCRKRKFDGGHQNQGETKRRYQSQNWGNQPLAQQPLDLNGDQQWYQDSYSAWS